VARALILVVIIGFPIALILAWAFEMSPQGMIRTTSKQAKSNPLPANKKKPLTGTVTIIVLVSLLVVQFVYYSFIRKPETEVVADEIREERVAVAPFNNYTGDANLDALDANIELDPLDPKIIHESAYYYLALNQPGKAVK